MTDEIVVVSGSKAIIGALLRLDVVNYEDMVALHPREVSREQVMDRLVVGSVPPAIATAAAEVWVPKWDLGEEPLRTHELIGRYDGFSAWSVEEITDDERPATLIAAGHEPLVEMIRRKGLALPDAPVLAHAQVDDVHGHVVIGDMSLEVAAGAEFAMAIDLPPGLVCCRELTLEQIEHHHGGVTRYRVKDVLPH